MLGRILFLIYIYDLLEVIDEVIQLFAGDAKIYNRVKRNEQPAANRIQSSFNKGVIWDKDWLVWLNFLKCHLMQIGKHSTPETYTMYDGNENIELETVDTEKYLGFIIDSSLTFREHLN